MRDWTFVRKERGKDLPGAAVCEAAAVGIAF